MKKTSKLKSKLCAWFLVCATVFTTLGSSSSMVFADNDTPQPQTETEFSTLSVKSGEGGEISVELPDGQIETASNGSDISVEVEKGSTVIATIDLAEGFEVSTYRLTTDSGDSKDVDVYESYSFDITENTTLEATYCEATVEETSTEPSTEPTDTSKVTEDVNVDVTEFDTDVPEETTPVVEEVEEEDESIDLPTIEQSGDTSSLDVDSLEDFVVIDEDTDGVQNFTLKVIGDGSVEYTRYLDGENPTTSTIDSTISEILPELSRANLVFNQHAYVFVIDSEKGLNLEPYSEQRENSFRDISITKGVDKEVYVIFNEEKAMEMLTATSISTMADLPSNVTVGKKYTGSCEVTKVNQTHAGGTVTSVTFGKFTGQLKGKTITGDCADHTAAAPFVGQDCNYTLTVKSISGNKVKCYLYVVPKKNATDGVTSNGSGLIGYQRMDATVTLTRTPPNTYTNLKVTKKWSDSSNAYGVRPKSITVYLYRSTSSPVSTSGKYYKKATLNASNKWTYTWKDELKSYVNSSGKKINYNFKLKEDVPKYYKGSMTGWSGSASAGYSATITNTVQSGKAYLKKSSNNSTLTSENKNYSLEGAKYGIYTNSACTKSTGKTLTTKADGTTNTVTLATGTYYVKETKASKGYMLDTTVHKVTISKGKTATITSKEPPMSVTINLTKVSDNPDATGINDLYTLEGAEYSIYSDSACTEYLDKITTDEDGKGTITGLPLNTYYVKETKAPQGFGTDTKVYTIEATTGTTAVVTKSITSTEPCLMDPVGILLKKVDAETGTKTPVDEGTLEDAQFEVKLYDTIMTEDPAESGIEPIWSTVMRTDEDGIIQLNNSYVVSGDQVPTDKDGYPSLPYGTLTFKEIKSPSGYLVNDTVIVKQIADKDGGLSTVPQYTEPTQKEQPMTLKIIKVQNGTTLRIPNAQFKWTLPDGSTHTYTTDENGEVFFKGLEWGKHTIEEVKVPDGYSVNQNDITFTVNQDNTITGASGATVTDTDGNFTLVIDENNLNPTVTYENKPAPFDLHVYKINDVDFALEGVEFTVYTDKDCTDVWKVGKTDSSGNLIFEDLIVGKTYYMKETDVPQGYRIPINDDGSDIVYKIKVTSTPVNDEFTFYVNDKPYTMLSTGNYSVSGTKADRVCDMTIINERGKRLPETGSNMMLVLLIAGVALMGGAIVVSQTRKSKKENNDVQEEI